MNLDSYIYHKEDAGVIYCGNNIDILPLLPKVDIVLTDPPYNGKAIGSLDRAYENGMMDLPENEYLDFCKSWFDATQLLSPNMIFTPGQKHIWNYPKAKWIICWHKPGAVCYSSIGGFNIWEPILIYGKVGKFSEDFISRVPLNLANCIETQHPCPKQKHVWEWLVEKGSKQEMTILDPFLGSGTTAVCAKKLNRRFIGIEISEKYCQIALERLRQSVMVL